MLFSDQKIDNFINHTLVNPDYNPQKAHEYYLQTRKLKGRQIGTTKPLLRGHNPGAAQPSSLGRLALSKASQLHAAKARKAIAEKHHKEIAARVSALQVRLTKLNKILAELTKQAGQSHLKVPGAKTPTQKATAKATAAANPKTSSTNLTGTQKAAKAKASKAYYQKHKNDATDANVAKIEAKIQAVTKKIAEMRSLIAQTKRELKTHPSAATRVR